MKKIFSRIAATVLSGIFLVTQSPTLFAEVANVYSDRSTFLVPESKILGEVKEKRSEFTKHFRMSDGTMKAITYSDPVHYKDGDEFREIDNTLIESENETYKNTNSPFKVNFSKNFKNKGLVKINSDNYEISLSYIKKKYKEFDNEVLPIKQEKLEATESKNKLVDDQLDEESSLESAEENQNVSESGSQDNLEIKRGESLTSPITRVKTKALTESAISAIPDLEPETRAVKIENLKDKQSRKEEKN